MKCGNAACMPIDRISLLVVHKCWLVISVDLSCRVFWSGLSRIVLVQGVLRWTWGTDVHTLGFVFVVIEGDLAARILRKAIKQFLLRQEKHDGFLWFVFAPGFIHG